MAIRRPTLRQLRQLMVAIGAETDQATRTITKSWVTAWDELAHQWRQAMDDAASYAARTGEWPPPWELGRIERLGRAMEASERALTQLSTRAGVTISDGAGQVVAIDADAEPRIVSSQVPAADAVAVASRFVGNVMPTALEMIVARAQAQIVSDLRPLSAQAADAMRRELVRGIAVGTNPRQAASQMVARVEGAFNGGLTRAINVARTEMLDAYRAASAYQQGANGDLLAGWQWHSALDGRTCPSCWSMHGRTFPLSQPGPLDHQQGRCARLPKTKSWRELGIDVPEPADDMPNAQTKFWALPADKQKAIMGPGRLRLLQSGRITWDDLPVERPSARWRTSYAPRTVGDLERIAALRGTGTPTPAIRPPAKVTTPKPITSKYHPTVDGDLEQVARLSRQKPTHISQLGGGYSAKTDRLTYRDGNKLVRKVYGQQSIGLRGSLRENADAEQLAPLVMNAVGVPAPTVYRSGIGTVYMRHVPGDLGSDIVPYGYDVPDAILNSDSGRLMGFGDFLMSHSDRNEGNWIRTTDGRIVPIDHGFAFLFGGTLQGNPFARYFIDARRNIMPNDISPADMARIRPRLVALLPQFEHIGRAAWHRSMMDLFERAARMARGTRDRLP